jgi:cell division protein FtsB
MLSLRTTRTLLATPIALLVLAILVLFVGRAFGIEFNKNMKLRRELAKLNADVAALEGSSRTLSAQLQALQRPFAIEREAREKYGLRRAGERVLILPEAAVGTGKEEGKHRERPAWQSNALAWWKYFTRN